MTLIEKKLKRDRSKMTFLRRIRSEAADSMTVFLITAIPFLLLFVGFTIDFTKNANVRSEYMDIAQEAAQASIREQDGNGSLLCGQDRTAEANPSVTSTPHYTIYGVDNARKFVNDPNSQQGISGSKPRPNNAQAVKLAVKSYLEKTGRSSGSSSVYGNEVASANDAHFVANMRSVVADADQRNKLDNNDAMLRNSATLDPSKATFSIEVWCTKGLGDAARQDKDPIEELTVGSGQKFNTINMRIRDWSGNFIMGMFNKNWATQSYTLTPRAVASWSQSALF